MYANDNPGTYTDPSGKSNEDGDGVPEGGPAGSGGDFGDDFPDHEEPPPPTDPGPVGQMQGAPLLPEAEARKFRNGTYKITFTKTVIHLFRWWDGPYSRELGPWWSRTYFATSAIAKEKLALPLKNLATRVTMIRVPGGQLIYEGPAAAQPQWNERGGGDQVRFPINFYVPKNWIIKSWCPI